MILGSWQRKTDWTYTSAKSHSLSQEHRLSITRNLKGCSGQKISKLRKGQGTENLATVASGICAAKLWTSPARKKKIKMKGLLLGKCEIRLLAGWAGEDIRRPWGGGSAAGTATVRLQQAAKQKCFCETRVWQAKPLPWTHLPHSMVCLCLRSGDDHS